MVGGVVWVGGWGHKGRIMKLKGINPFEQHVEKAVLGVAGAAFVGVMVWQFLLTKPTVKVGTQAVPPGAAFEPAEAEAARILARMEQAAPELPAIQPPSVQTPLPVGSRAPVLAAAAGGTALGFTPTLKAAGAASVADASFAPLQLPVMTGVAAATYRAAISPIERVRSSELANLLPAQQPFDKASVSIEGVFDGAAVRRALETDPDGTGPLSAVPLAWWRETGTVGGSAWPIMEILGVEVERRTVRNADGSTPTGDAAQPKLLPAPPDRPRFVQAFRDQVKTLSAMPPLLVEVREAGEEVLRPSFYQIVSGTEWAPPAEASAGAGNADEPVEVRLLRGRLAQVDRAIRRAQESAAQAPRSGAGRGDESGGRGAGGRGGGGGDPRGGGGTGGGDADAAQRERAEADRQRRIAESIERSERERADLVRQLAALNVRVDGGPATAGGAGRAPAAAAEPKPWTDEQRISLWTHDLTVEPGAVYQYRIRPVISNPFFGRGLRDDQRQLGERSTLEGAWSEWTAPVTVERDREFFVSSATLRDPSTRRPRASAELYQFYYGFYRKTVVSADQGDAFAGRITLPDDLKFVDMNWLEQEWNAGRAPDLAFLGGLPPVGPDGQPVSPDGRGGDVDPRDRGGRGFDESGRSTRGAGAAGGTGENVPTTDAPRQLPVVVDAMFLGVREVPTAPNAAMVAAGQAGAVSALEVVLRDPVAGLVTSSPEANRTNETSRRLAASAQAAIDARKPPEAPRPEPRPVEPRPQPRPRPTPTGGGGGGGSGGG